MTISSPVERSRPQRAAGDQENRLKKVLFVLGLDPAGKFGSIEEQVFTLSRAFHERSGLFLPVFLRPLDPESAARYAKEGLAVESLDLRRFRIGTLRRLLHLVRSHEIEVVHWNFYHPLFNGYLWWVSVLSPRVQHFYTDHISRPRDEPATRRGGRLKSLLKGALSSRYRKVLCVSDYVLGRSRELPWIRPQRIHHFINTGRFRPDSTVRREVRQALGVNDEFVVVAIAYLIEDKGIDVAVRAIAALPERVMLWVVGDGPELGNLQTLARSLGLERRLRFLGPRAQVEPFLQGADCFVCPSLWAEAAGLVNLEAMACGLPVVASRIGGIPELVRHEETGLLFTPGDHDELAQRLLGLLRDEQLRSVLGQRARSSTLERFSIQSQIDEYLGLYRTGQKSSVVPTVSVD